ncbi:MAG: threonine synthase [Lachnospiraceae bacterium]|nr:threonine synthase [Candidatus Equihabitans merdae]
MNVLYKSTRSDMEPITASKAILTGLSSDGGLFVPTEVPSLPCSLKEMSEMSYQELAYQIMSQFLSDYTEEELRGCIERAYDVKFDDPAIAPLREADGVYYLELFHGATIAFKDMALSILPHLMTTAAKKNNLENEIVILTATSGDTGKAAMAGFADVPGTSIIVFYPKDGVSKVQEKQMVTQRGENTAVVAIKGNFDDAQNRVKAMFNDQELAKELADKGYQFSSANSINIGRLVPQIVYYVYAYATLLKNGKIAEGDEINITVPTGNFGNILAAYYARQMGLPVKTLVCASNENKVLYDFFASGNYNKNRPFILTSSPSMDILISSNLERLIYHLCGNDPVKNKEFMTALVSGGEYTITEEMREGLKCFVGGFATEEENFAGIKALYEKSGYVIDTHTGIANVVCRRFMDDNKDCTPMVVASTASPFKFSRAVMGAIAPDLQEEDDFKLIDELTKASGVKEPNAITDIRTAPVRHNMVVDKDDMKAAVKEILGL